MCDNPDHAELLARLMLLEQRLAADDEPELAMRPECIICPDCRDGDPCAYEGECWDCIGYAAALSRMS